MYISPPKPEVPGPFSLKNKSGPVFIVYELLDMIVFNLCNVPLAIYPLDMTGVNTIKSTSPTHG